MISLRFKSIKLELIVLVAGTSVMVLELIGSRILAPYLGTSMFVWSSLIGVVLGALTLGYYIGGYFSEKNPSLKFLGLILFLTGVNIFLIAFIKDDLLRLCLGLGVKAGAVVSAILLFALPGVLFGMVSPYAIRLKIKDIQTSGQTAGKLYALSTLGSIAGTFLAGFFLIPVFGSTQIIYGLSLVLILTSLLGSLNPVKFLFLFLIAIVAFFPIQPKDGVVYEFDSEYNHIRVIDRQPESQRPVRILYMATEAHSVIYLDSDELYPGYFQHYQLDQIFKPDIKKALTLGGGAYVGPVNFLKRFPGAEMTVVEIDPAVTETAKKYFQLKDDPRLKIVHEDARIFINQNREKYDVIYGDAFSSFYSIPFQLTTKEALGRIYEALNDDGVLLFNVISSITGRKSDFFQAEYKTLSTVFPQIYLFPVSHNDPALADKPQNIMIVATKQIERLSREEMYLIASESHKFLIDHLWTEEIKIDPKTRLLSDDFAPVDYYISKLL